jgi:hypothetical protein
MIIDIGAHLRRLVLAGLPLLAVGCDSGPLASDRSNPAPLAAACRPRMVIEESLPPGTRTLAIGFARNDPRVADLHEACVGQGNYCVRLCQEVLQEADIQRPPGHVVSGPYRCELACDRTGEPVATLSFMTFVPPVPGRRPDGFDAALATAPGTSLAAFFAGCAALEGASIRAFCTLADELDHHGAPPALAARARQAAREEARHFKATARLARRFGSPPVRCPRPPSAPPRDLSALALENVIEGCVNETFAAAVALWQATHAADPQVRAALAGIAEDELAHAQLAWDVHQWASECLGRAATRKLARARARAAHQLLHASARPVDPALVEQAGLPDAPTAIWLATQASALWGGDGADAPV